MIQKEYIKESGTVTAENINALISERMQGGTMLIMSTEEFSCTVQQEIQDIAHLLEVRVFTEQAELKIMRPSIEDDFSYRLIVDTPGEFESVEESQYLDIAESHGNVYTATGGGVYTLPVENAEKIIIRNYISYDEQGIGQITDFRIVKFLERS